MHLETKETPMLKQWITALIGLAVLSVPFMGMSQEVMMWTLIVSGILITGLSLLTAYEMTGTETEVRTYREIHV